MRDMVVLAALLVFIALGARSTYRAYLLWGWMGLISLGDYLYGFMVSVPYVQIFALITLGSMFFRKDPDQRRYKPNRTTTMFIIFVVHGLLCALLAYPDLNRNWELFGNLTKTVLFCSLMPLLATSRFRIHAMIVMIALAVSFHGALDGLKFMATGGAHKTSGIAKFGDNNHFALVMLMAIPLLYYLYQYSSQRLLRWGFGFAILLNVLAVVATNSRGGLLGLFAVAIWIILQSRRKILGIFAITVCALLVTQLASKTWTTRMETMKSADEDVSFMARVTAWKVSSSIAIANPVFGGGFRAVQSHPVWNQFKYADGLLGFVETPPNIPSGRAAHSIWFEVMGDLGFVGFFIFFALIINSYLTRNDIIKLVKKGGESHRWAGDLSDLLGASMLVYVVSGSLLSAAYFELPYIFMILLEVIKQQLLSEFKGVPAAQ